MRKKLVLKSLTAVSIAVFILAACANLALAITTQTEHENAGGSSVIDVPGHPNIRLTVDHFDKSDYYRGSAERFTMYVFTTSGPLPFKAVAAYEDNPTRIAFSKSLETGVVQNPVKRGQIQVFRIGKTVFAYWTIPLVAPATANTPEVTLPPGLLVLRGYGPAKSGVIPPLPVGPTGWKVALDIKKSYDADATLVCLGWHYCGPVAEASTPGVITDITYTWTHP